jgi:hypothetical protein
LWGCVFDLGDVSGELVAAAGQGGDKIKSLIPKGFADKEDVLRKVGFFNNRVWPDGFQEFVFGDGAAGVFGQVDEQIEGLSGERDGAGGAQQLASGAVECELAELQAIDSAGP